MDDEARADAAMSIGADLETAAAVVDAWGRTSDEYTGRWLDPRDALIGVGIITTGDDEATREHLQSAVPDTIRVRVRLVSAQWVRLHQLQVHVSYYLHDQGFSDGVGRDRSRRPDQHRHQPV